MKRLTSFALVLLLLLSACAKSTSDWQTQYDLGVRYLSESNYEEAIIAFTAAIEIDPKRPDAYLALADTYEAMGDTEAALAILEQGIDATGDETLSDRLAEWADGASDTAGDQGWYAYHQGMEAHQNGDYAQALELLDGVVAALTAADAPDETLLLLSAGAAVRVCYETGDNHAALGYFAIVEAYGIDGSSGIGGEWGSVNTMIQPETGGKTYDLYDGDGERLLNISIYDKNGTEVTIYRYNDQVEVYENGRPVENLYVTDTGIGWTSPNAD